jgi:hypothetical protein
MNILLDSHTFIWLSEESAKLSSRVIDLFENRQNLLFLSVASVWEMQIKIQLGKLKGSPVVRGISFSNHQKQLTTLTGSFQNY